MAQELQLRTVRVNESTVQVQPTACASAPTAEEPSKERASEAPTPELILKVHASA